MTDNYCSIDFVRYYFCPLYIEASPEGGEARACGALPFCSPMFKHFFMPLLPQKLILEIIDVQT